MSASTNTGTSPYCNEGLTVVGKPVAQVITSSPGFSWRLRSKGEQSDDRASKFADEPELVVIANLVPIRAASLSWNSVLKRPVVSHMSRLASTSERQSASPTTLPETGTGLWPATKGRGACANAA